MQDTHLKNAGELLQNLFYQTDIIPGSASELETIVRKLYDAGHKASADAICQYVGDRKDSVILKEIYEKINKFKATL